MEKVLRLHEQPGVSSPYSTRSGLVLGFHGTDESVVRSVVLNECMLKFSNNKWDWIGHGIYFWENSPSRAMEFAQLATMRKGSTIKTPGVIGAVLDLGHCLDLLDYGNMDLLKGSYRKLRRDPEFEQLQNRRSANQNVTDFLIRNLDCAVIETVHDLKRFENEQPFDSVKAVFWEGNLLYPNAGFREKNHIQICIRNPNCIKGFFIPRATE